MGKDYFEDDTTQGDRARRDSYDPASSISSRYSSDAVSNKLAKQKEDMMNHVAVASQEIEQLRIRQEMLEKERREIEELARKEAEYEKGKVDIIEKIARGITQLEKDELQATRMVELLAAMRARFKDTLTELRSIDESTWTEENFQLEINKAMVVVEDAKSVHKKAVAQIEAASWQKQGNGKGQLGVLDTAADDAAEPKDFKYWFNVGLGLTAPVIISLVFLFVVYLIASGLIFARSAPPQ
ncbi:MAG: hypothetical protein C0404_05505 [Verrucomicrobia bacterium]|nr:hypothetical protein [Verrucomicrobiota bacterium]